MYPNSSKDTSPLSGDSSDQFDKMMDNIMQGSFAMAFRQLIEPTDKKSIDSKSPPPLKLHDFGGSDFVRLAEKARRNRSTVLKSQEPATCDLASLSNGHGASSSISAGHTTISLVVENESSMKQTNQKLSPNNDWKCTQECVFRTDGSEETVYQKFHDGQVTDSLHHVVYPDGTIKNIKKPIIPTSPSAASSLSSISDDATSTVGPFKRLWYLVFN